MNKDTHLFFLALCKSRLLHWHPTAFDLSSIDHHTQAEKAPILHKIGQSLILLVYVAPGRVVGKFIAIIILILHPGFPQHTGVLYIWKAFRYKAKSSWQGYISYGVNNYKINISSCLS